MSILNELKQRRILQNITNEQKFKQLPKGVGVYIGFDPTATSLHLGNFVQISILKKFANYGFVPIAVLGGATGMIGDPSGKHEERSLLSPKILDENKQSIKKQLLSFGFEVIDNYEFYQNTNILDFLRETGKLLNVSYMINKDVVKSRLETGISFTELSYQLIQGWDFKKLYDEHNVMIQVGGSDQWGNITSGIEMIRKTSGEKNLALGITTKLLTTSSGKKFGKSEKGALFLNKNMTSSFELYQYLFNTSDDDVEKLLLWLSDKNISEITDIMQLHKKQTSSRSAQKELAYNVVSQIHSRDDANIALNITSVLFGNESIKKLACKDIDAIENLIPTFENINGNIVDVLVKIKAVQSKREARELITNGAIEVNGIKVSSLDFGITFLKSSDREIFLIKKGKKKFFLLEYKK